jgi:predicted dehydrogenase
MASPQLHRPGQTTSEPPFAASAQPREPSRRRSRQTAPAAAAIQGPIDVILVGSGRAAQNLYVPALNALQAGGELNVRTVVDASEAARAYLARAFPNALTLPSLDAAVVPPGALVIIATPPRFHSAQAVAALKRGWHVVCEPPLAGSVRDAATMIAAARRHERLLAVNLYRRSFPAVQYLRALCRDHLLGPVLSFTVHEGEGNIPPDTAVKSFDKPERAEGVLTDVGVHAFDLLAWCLGTPTVLSYADDAMGGVEANAFIELAFPEGVRGTVHLSRDWPSAQRYDIAFERGHVQWRVGEANRLVVQLANAPAALQASLVAAIGADDHPGSPSLQPSFQQSFTAHIRNIRAAIGNRGAEAVSAAESLQSLAALEECYGRRTFLEQPWLTPNEAAHARALCLPAAPGRPL